MYSQALSHTYAVLDPALVEALRRALDGENPHAELHRLLSHGPEVSLRAFCVPQSLQRPLEDIMADLMWNDTDEHGPPPATARVISALESVQVRRVRC